jgi:CHAT domain-containing protein
MRGKDAMVESTTLQRMAVILLGEVADGPRDARADQALALAGETLTLAHASGSRYNDARIRLVLGSLGPPGEAAGHFEHCIAYAREVADDLLRAECLAAFAHVTAGTDPAGALARVDQAVAAARSTGERRVLAGALGMRALLLWRAGNRAAAHTAMEEALAAIEAVRDLQRDDRVRLELLADRGDLYYRFSGLRFEAGDLEEGWRTIERLRARTLLERLDAGRATEAIIADTAARRRRDAVLDRIQGIQRDLVAGVPAERRAALLAELERAESDEAGLREQAAASDPTFGTLHPRPAPLADVRAALADDEALLSYQLGVTRDLWGQPSGGSWLIAITRAGVHAIRLPDRSQIAPAVDAFAGLVAGGDAAAEAAARLHRDLLAPALALIGPQTRRLIIVPDGALFRMPFAALRADAAGPPLIAGYDLEIAASATTWLRLRARSPAGSRALVLADPELPSATGGAAEERGWALATAAQLGPLPHARDEAAAIARDLGDDALLLLGPDASEAELKRRDLGEVAILHFAAHALVDENFPDRSAVLLSPGAADQDGLLQPREIAALDAAGRVVVLSACRSAAGEVMRGEGLMDLTRTFLIAGARAVIGSMWQVRDDDAEALVDALYGHLSPDLPLASALAMAQRDRAAAGAPPSAWAGFVLVGDGSRGVAVHRRAPRHSHRASWIAVAAALVGLGLWSRRRRR